MAAEKKDLEENLSLKVSDLTNYKDRLLNENEEKNKFLLNVQRENTDVKDALKNESIHKNVVEWKN